MKNAAFVIVALALSLPALGQESVPAGLNVKRTLQDVARELKLKPKEDRIPGTVSVMESTVNRAQAMGWDQVIEGNQAYLDSLRAAPQSQVAPPEEIPVIANGYYGYGGNAYGYRPRVSAPSIAVPRRVAPSPGFRVATGRGFARWAGGRLGHAHIPR